MTEPVFVDTNIFVYARDASEQKKQLVAENYLRDLWTEHRGRTSTQVLSEYYVTVTRKLEPGLPTEVAWQDVLALMAWEPQESDRQLLVRARDIEHRFMLSWWDSMIVAAAQAQACPVLLSEDFQNGMTFDDTTVLNPFITTVSESKAAYSSRAPKPKSRHRSRGRPARVTS
jgi:predicted nucleic acid-binding protein